MDSRNPFGSELQGPKGVQVPLHFSDRIPLARELGQAGSTMAHVAYAIGTEIIVVRWGADENVHGSG